MLRAPVGHAFVHIPQATHLNGSLSSSCCIIESSGQNPTHIKHPTQSFLFSFTTPFLSLTSANVGHTSIHTPHCVHMVSLFQFSIAVTLTLDFSGLFSLKYAWEHASSHFPHPMHLLSSLISLFTLIVHLRN